MCFGRRDWSNDPASRPAKLSSQYDRMSNHASSSQYPGPPLYSQHPPPQQHPNQQEYAPPPGPPPQSIDGKAKTQHDWQSLVPDTSLFPPPPALFSGHDRSPLNNATEAEAEAGTAWCARYPLVPPMGPLDEAGRDAVERHNYRLVEPAGGPGAWGRLEWLGVGRWRVRREVDGGDGTVISYPPMYMAGAAASSQHQGMGMGRGRAVIYYEVKIDRSSPSASVAMGFAALPYPPFRLPGWHRGSLAVHGDDGRRYVNDVWGGRDFVEAFCRGETYGIGMRLGGSDGTGGGGGKVEVFFTRNGREVGGWDLHEETDAEENMPVVGLEGGHDLCCAVGTFERVDFEVVFEPERWMYKM